MEQVAWIIQPLSAISEGQEVICKLLQMSVIVLLIRGLSLELGTGVSCYITGSPKYGSLPAF